MNNKSETQIRFSAAKFKRLPMAEKLAYLRAALSALGNGLQVLERRRSTPRTPVPDGETMRQRVSAPSPPASLFTRALSRANFEQLSLEDKCTYLSWAFLELKQAQRRMRSAAPERITARRQLAK
jgi:hypothetical protein